MVQRVNLKNLPDLSAHIELFPLIKALHERKDIVVIAGAGISESAGVPTFEMVPKKKSRLFRMSSYNTEVDTRELNEMLCDMFRKIEDARPTQFHLVIARLAEEDSLLRLYTQNIDGIDRQLPLLDTLIPLPDKGPWPKTVQLHGDLKTVCCMKNPTHLAPFNPASFDLGSIVGCAQCEEDAMRDKALNKRERGISRVRPRICLYEDNFYADEGAINKVQAADYKKKVGAVIVVGTALRVPSAKRLTEDMCRCAHDSGGFTAWINFKPPPQDLHCFDLVVIGDCQVVAKHVSCWWLMGPDILSDFHIQEFQKKWRELVIGRSPEAVLERLFPEVDNLCLQKILLQEENKARVLGIEKNGQAVFVLAEGSTRPGIRTKEVINQNIQTTSQLHKDQFPASALPPSSHDIPELPDCWETEMSKRLRKVEVQVTNLVHTSSSKLTTITNLPYKAHPTKSLWCLKPGEYLNDEVMNAYLELLPGFEATSGHSIQNTFILTMKPEKPYKSFKKLMKNESYRIYIPINHGFHWTFAVITNTKNDSLRWTFYDSLGGKPPQKFLSWMDGVFDTQKIESPSPQSSPIQENNFDCGLFVLLGIRLLSSGRCHISQARSDVLIPKFRQRVLAELLATSLNPSSCQYVEFQRNEAHAETILFQEEKAGDANPQVKSRDSSVLFVSPPPDPIEGAEKMSLDELDESKEELVQTKPSKQKAAKSPVQIASTFAGEASMVRMLREAVLLERALNKGSRSSKLETMQLSDLWCMISTETRGLRQRYVHYEFSRRFWTEVERLNGGPHQYRKVPKAAISGVMSKLAITDHTRWKYILKRARRASVWTELIDIFKNELEDPSVVLCALPDATSTLETMTLINRKVLFEIIRSKIEQPDNQIVENFKAASNLWKAIKHNALPKDLTVESSNEHLQFKELVSCRK